MTEKQKYWVRNEAGEYALLDGAAERDRMSAFGWTETDVEPGPDTFVWMRHEGIEQPAKFPVGSVEGWIANGWVPSAPPEYVDVTKEQGNRAAWAEALGFPTQADPAPAPKAPAKTAAEKNTKE